MFPNGYRAALSLTFDDARLSQIDRGMRIFDDRHVRATFYVSFGALEQRVDGWRKAVSAGHEIGNHTITHPCTGNFPWSRNNALEDYTPEKMDSELVGANERIQALLGVKPATFAYPCGNTEYGTPPTSYVPLLESRFFAARGVNCCALAPSSVDLSNVNTYWPPSDATATTITAPVDQAMASGSLLVYGFHAVDDSPGEWSAVPQAAHDALVAYLAEKKASLWVTTFGEATSYVKRCR